MKIRDYCDSIKHSNICILGVQEAKEREKGIKNRSEDMLAKNFSKLMKEIDIQVQEGQRVPSKVTPKQIHNKTRHN